jgi:hypothetical protein
MYRYILWMSAAIGALTNAVHADAKEAGVMGVSMAAILTHGAVVLGALGLGLVGWYLRKRA